jgi:hypothetical protein
MLGIPDKARYNFLMSIMSYCYQPERLTMIRHYALYIFLTCAAISQPAHAFFEDFDMDEFMVKPRRWMSDIRKNFASSDIQGISNCAVSSNDQEIVISLNLLQPIDPALIKSHRSGDTVTVHVRLGNQNYKLSIKSHGGKLSYSCAVEQREHQDVAQSDVKSHSSSHMSSFVQQSFPADVDLSGVAIELDGTMLHVHIPRTIVTAPQEIPLKVKSKKI